MKLHDLTRNIASEPLEAPLLYHVNLGPPLWEDGALVESDAATVVPRDAEAAAGPWAKADRVSGLKPQTHERVYEHVGATRAAATNDALRRRVRVESNLPRLWQWIDPSLHALGLEPANCSVLGRAHDRAAGRLPFLAPGEERETRIVVTAEAR